MTTIDHAGLAAELRAAHESRAPIGPISASHPSLTLSDAYRIQRELTTAWTKDGRVLRGRKVGLTSLPMQMQLGVGQPDFGVIFADMIYATGASIAMEDFISPKVEPELAIVLSRDLAGPTLASDVLPAIESVAPALEIIDTRIADWKIGIVDTVADNASSGALVLGRPMSPHSIDFRGMGCIFRRDGEIVDTGAGGAVLGSPLQAVAWLATTLSDFGEGLRAGDVILPGSITSARAVAPGENWSAQMSGVGTVTADFVSRARS